MASDDERPVKLRDGSSLLIRPIRPDDKAALAAGFERLSPTSRYRRFFAPRDRLSDADLAHLTEVDHHDHEAVIGFAPDGEPAGVARYVRTDEPDSAEVAVTVVDEWHGRGVATALLERLVERAREEGVERFMALILSENKEAIELFRNLSVGDPEPAQSASGHLELLIELPAPDGVSGSKLGRALRSAASGDVEMSPWRLLKRPLRRLADRDRDE